MPADFKSSFIPKEPTRKKRRPQKASKGGLMGLVTTIIIVLVILAVGGSFLYQKFLESRLESKIEELRQVEESLDPVLIGELVKLNTRLTSAKDLLENHVAVSNLFDELESETSHSVRFTSLGFSLDPLAGEHTLSMEGQSRDFNAVAHQSDVFGANPMFHDVVFSGLAVDNETGNITFNFSSVVDSGLIDYQANSNSGI